jgi:hypothetical protein
MRKVAGTLNARIRSLNDYSFVVTNLIQQSTDIKETFSYPRCALPSFLGVGYPNLTGD